MAGVCGAFNWDVVDVSNNLLAAVLDPGDVEGCRACGCSEFVEEEQACIAHRFGGVAGVLGDSGRWAPGFELGFQLARGGGMGGGDGSGLVVG